MKSTPTAADRVLSMIQEGPVVFASLTIVERNEMVRLCRRGIATNIRDAAGGTYYVVHPARVVEASLRRPMVRL